jgi:serine/threonine protein kinase
METAEGLEYLHSLRVVHGDLNDVRFPILLGTSHPLRMIQQCNILIDEDRHVRLSDFGLTILDDMTGVNTPTTAGGPAGPGGMWISADRLTRGDHRRLTNDDVYAFGCLCYYVRSL